MECTHSNFDSNFTIGFVKLHKFWRLEKGDLSTNFKAVFDWNLKQNGTWLLYHSLTPKERSLKELCTLNET